MSSGTVRDGRRTGRGIGVAVGLLRLGGALLLLAIAGIHAYLWQQGYRSIDAIGPGFLLQTVLAVGGALLVLGAPPRWVPWAAGLTTAFCVGSLAALLVSTTVGLFGFVETTQATLWWETLWVEIAGIVVLGTLTALAARRR